MTDTLLQSTETAKSAYSPREQIGVGDAFVSEKAKSYVMDALDRNRLSYNKYIPQFETMFAEAHEVNHAIFCNSGTSSLRVAIAALKELDNWQEGDEVIAPALTFVATTNVVVDHGLVPVLVDVDPRTYNIDPSLIEAAITEKTRAIMPVHLFGQPCDMDPIMEIARKYNLRVIEDSAETMFARYKGRPVGSFGDISCFSTYIAHILVTGVGGFACSSDPEIAVILKSLVNHGRDSIYLHVDDDKGIHGKQLLNVVQRRFRFERLGYSFRCTEMEGALGVAQMEEKDGLIAARQKNAALLTELLSDLQDYIQLPWYPEESEHVFMMYPIVITDTSISKDDLVLYLEEHAIETRDMLPLTNQPVYTKLLGEDLEDRFPRAKHINHFGFYIGCHPRITEDDIHYISHTLHDFFSQ